MAALRHSRQSRSAGSAVTTQVLQSRGVRAHLKRMGQADTPGSLTLVRQPT